MKGRIMFHMTVSLLADIMLWGSIPLWAILGFWEEHLTLGNTGHEIAQIILMFLVLGWAYAWNRIGDRDRLTHLQSRHAKQAIVIRFESEIKPDPEIEPSSDESSLKPHDKKSVYWETLEDVHVSKN